MEKRIFSKQNKVYISHFLSSWGDRMWAFSGGLFLIEITPGSLRLLAIYAASLSLTVVFMGSAVGRWVDRTKRLRAARTALVLQNSMVCICTTLLCLLIQHKEFLSSKWNGWALVFGEVGAVFVACIAQLGTLASKLYMEKDWIVIISGRDESKLSTMNSVCRTIDLSTKMLAPVLVGFVMASSGTIAGGILIAVWNVVSMVVEYGLLYHLYYTIEELRKPKPVQNITSANSGKTKRLREAIVMWRRYFKHRIALAGMALAFLYMTVLSLDNYTVAYVYESGVSKGVIGIVASIGSLTGIIGSILFPIFQKRFGYKRTGIIGFLFELACLTFCVVAMFSPGTLFQPQSLFSPQSLPSKDALQNNAMESSLTMADQSSDREYTSVILLLIGIIISRPGLWLADLSVTQLLQTKVVASERGGMNGVQSSLNQLFNLFRSILLMIFPSMATFGYLVILSYIFVAIGAVLFIFYCRTSDQRDSDAQSVESVTLINSDDNV